MLLTHQSQEDVERQLPVAQADVLAEPGEIISRVIRVLGNASFNVPVDQGSYTAIICDERQGSPSSLC